MQIMSPCHYVVVMVRWGDKSFKRIKVSVEIIISFFFLLLLTFFPVVAEEPLFADLEKRLIDDGIDADLVRGLYRHPAVKLEPSILAVNLKRSEKALNYNQYLTEATVLKAKHYLNQHQDSLEKAFEQFGVPPPIIVAILTVETWLGTYNGKYPTINILSTMAVAEDPRVQERIFSFLEVENNIASQKELIPLLKQRVNRGYRELKSLLEYLRTTKVDPFYITGSVEGAVGIPQFMPSNINRYGQDGNNDSMIDLFNHADAIASVAGFLQAHNWNQARGVTEKKQVLLRYNRSNYYVDTVYSLAERIEKYSP